MSDIERKLKDIIYEVICDIESDFNNELTIEDIYKKLVKVRELDYDWKKAVEVEFENDLEIGCK